MRSSRLGVAAFTRGRRPRRLWKPTLTRFALSVLRCWNCFNWLNYRLLYGGLLFNSNRFLFHSSGFLLHGLSALTFNDPLALNRENDFSRSGQPDRHTASGWHVFLRRRFRWRGARI